MAGVRTEKGSCSLVITEVIAAGLKLTLQRKNFSRRVTNLPRVTASEWRKEIPVQAAFWICPPAPGAVMFPCVCLFQVTDWTQHSPEAHAGKTIFPAHRGFLPHRCFLSELSLHQNGTNILFYVNGIAQCICFKKIFQSIFWFCSTGTRTQGFAHLTSERPARAEPQLHFSFLETESL